MSCERYGPRACSINNIGLNETVLRGIEQKLYRPYKKTFTLANDKVFAVNLPEGNYWTLSICKLQYYINFINNNNQRQLIQNIHFIRNLHKTINMQCIIPS